MGHAPWSVQGRGVVVDMACVPVSAVCMSLLTMKILI